ncbi:hypothetical protein LUZ60_008147 [Juncus effusus]|nr:hypothetical protein LUZ60_008147 [Juncus effusus]
MHQAIPYSNTRPWPRSSDLLTMPVLSQSGDARQAVQENAVVVVGKRGCCMSHVVKRLLQGLGVNPIVCEVSTEDEMTVVRDLSGDSQPDSIVMTFPAVFIGGKFLGGLDRLMAVHISGELVPILKEAGALWL